MGRVLRQSPQTLTTCGARGFLCCIKASALLERKESYNCRFMLDSRYVNGMLWFVRENRNQRSSERLSMNSNVVEYAAEDVLWGENLQTDISQLVIKDLSWSDQEFWREK